MSPADLAKIRAFDAACTWPESAMFGVTLDRRRCLEHIDALTAERDNLEAGRLSWMDTRHMFEARVAVLEARVRELEIAHYGHSDVGSSAQPPTTNSGSVGSALGTKGDAT